MSFVAIGWQVYAVHSNPLDLGLVGLAMFIPLPLLALPAGHRADRYPRRTLLALATLLDAAVMLGLLSRHPSGSRCDLALLRARVRHGRRDGARLPGLAGDDAVARAARDPRARARPCGRSSFQASVIAGPALGGLLFAIHSELVYAVAASLSLVSLVGMLLAPRRARRRPAARRPTSRACSAACG